MIILDCKRNKNENPVAIAIGICCSLVHFNKINCTDVVIIIKKKDFKCLVKAIFLFAPKISDFFSQSMTDTKEYLDKNIEIYFFRN